MRSLRLLQKFQHHEKEVIVIIHKKLTTKQQKFVEEVVSGKSQSDAYKAAYNVGKMQPSTIRNEASKLLKNPDVTAMLKHLREKATARVQYDTEDAMIEADEAFKLAMNLGEPSAAVAAITLKAKLMGLIVKDRKNEKSPLADLSDDELDALIKSFEDQLDGKKAH
jgi:phage terminase small subunit